MKKIILIISVLLLSNIVYSQGHKRRHIKQKIRVKKQISRLVFQTKKQITNRLFNNKNLYSKPHNGFLFTTGPVLGDEFFFGAMKANMIKVFPLSFNQQRKRLTVKNYPILGYVSAHVGGGAFFTFWGGLGVNVGISVYNITFDNSITTVSMFPGLLTKTSYDPKIGICLGDIWLKVGPSFNFYGESLDVINVKGNSFNFEIAVFIKDL